MRIFHEHAAAAVVCGDAKGGGDIGTGNLHTDLVRTRCADPRRGGTLMLGNGVAFKLDIPPGINKDDSTFDAFGQWVDGDGFRFVRSKPETIGGAVQAAGATGLV